MIHRYHDGTKHAFHRFARSLGYLDWESQPNPFRSFAGAPTALLPPRPDAPDSFSHVGTILRHALGLTAWKRLRESKWSLRANPSSGNLHPTEAYVVTGGNESAGPAAVWHYAPDRHVLERRCEFGGALPPETALIALTSIHWREAWKYGERAFRYCQHDIGHAIAAVRYAATLTGWTARLLPGWSHARIAALVGIDREEDRVDAEKEEPGCLLVVGRQPNVVEPESLIDTLRTGRWTGHASRLSEDHVQWTFIDEIAEATRDPGRSSIPHSVLGSSIPDSPVDATPEVVPARILLRRRSAVAFDGHSSIDIGRVIRVLRATMPGRLPFDALWWSARIHLVLFVHRVAGLEPGIYLLLRERDSGERLKSALGREFLMESASGDLPLICLVRGDCRSLARRLSCDQDIAADGFFSLGMIAEFDRSLAEFGPSFYRHLFWEAGVVGQVLYVEAERAGVRGTGIGCFYDDPVHEVLGLTGHAFQSLYHFTVGVPVEDPRLSTEPGYSWETS